MTIQSVSTLKQYYRTGFKPTQTQFWDWLDSFRHKSETVPAGEVAGLADLLALKVDKKDIAEPEIWDPLTAYVYNEAVQQYVSYINEESENQQFQSEGFYRLKASTSAGQSPESHPEKWAYQGNVMGEITIDDVVGLREVIFPGFGTSHETAAYGDHTHSVYQLTSQKDAANGYAGLDAAGKINPLHLPAVAIVNTFVVDTQAAMLALDCETGDVAIRTDLNKSFILRGNHAETLEDWQELLSPTDQVASVFGRNGVVTAQSGDYTTDQITETATRVFLSPEEKSGFVKLAGRAGGQSIAGGTAADENLYLTSTSHETKNLIIFGSSCYNEKLNRFGIDTYTTSFDFAFGRSLAREIGIERSASGAGRILTISAQAAEEGAADLAGGNLHLKSGISTGQGYSKVYISTPYTADGYASGSADNPHQICASFGFEDWSTVAAPFFRLYSKTGSEVFKIWGRSGSSMNIKPLSGTSFVFGGDDFYSDGVNTRFFQINAQNAINSGTNIKGGELRLYAGKTRGTYESAVMIGACPAGPVSSANSIITHLKIYGTTGLVWNDDGYDANCRFEGDNDPNMVVFDASADSIGFGILAPASKHHVAAAAAAVNTQWTNTATGHTASNGFHVGIDVDGNAIVDQKSNLPLIFKVNGNEYLRISSAGHLSMLQSKYFDLSTLPTEDTINDIRFRNDSGLPRFERCSVANGTKWSGTWKDINEPQTLTDAATITLNVRNGRNATVTLGGNRILEITNAVAGDSGVLKIVQDATGGRDISAWPTGSKFGGGDSDLSGSANAIDILGWYYDGTNYFWSKDLAFA